MTEEYEIIAWFWSVHAEDGDGYEHLRARPTAARQIVQSVHGAITCSTCLRNASAHYQTHTDVSIFTLITLLAFH